jgi:DNA mismatch endonuclease (patch repair protein)
MTDVHSRRQRSFNMSRIRSADTKPEVLLRSLLHRGGLRFRKNVSRLPGRPDIVLPRHNTAIFVHGCFWHRHEGCRYASNPASNEEFWKAKFARTVERDIANSAALEKLGWSVKHVWECELKKQPAETAKKILTELRTGRAA